ncbi:c-type cytochrome [Elongatibacter sediminis]|uniref:Cytochrome c n=1 Tax=Elongatibacter sediminis TaxID=3119006 RepID=A0AAW9RF03_9GAMM
MKHYRLILGACLTAVLTFPAAAEEAPQEIRHELMESVGDAAEPLGGMLKGEREFDAEVAMESLRTFQQAAAEFGDLFPEGSDTGYDTEARSTIWSDRAGFETALASFGEAVDTAIAAQPQSLDELKPVAGAVFKQCKGCHEDYRIEDD